MRRLLGTLVHRALRYGSFLMKIWRNCTSADGLVHTPSYINGATGTVTLAVAGTLAAPIDTTTLKYSDAVARIVDVRTSDGSVSRVDGTSDARP